MRKTLFKILIPSVAICLLILGIYGNGIKRQSSNETTIIPDYNGQEIIELNGNEPEFTDKTYNGTYILLSPLDNLGRCGKAEACVGKETEPKEEREDISKVKPSGWKQTKLPDGNYLYNRSHLLMFALTGLQDERKNLITGTEYFNKELMLPYETQIKSVVDNYNAHVLVRVTPVYDNNNLVAKGIQYEAYAIEYPEECSFNVFIYNIEPNVEINYETGEAKSVIF